jgi:lipopolysaccharide export system permease protein
MLNFLFSTLNRYFCRYFLFWFLSCLAIILCIVSLFEGIELLRRATARHNIPLSLISEMVLLKLPSHLNLLLPFISFFAAIISLWRLNQNHEILVARAAGVSVWQLVGGLNIATFLIYASYLAIINPIGAAMIGRYSRLEGIYFSNAAQSLSVSSNGLWLSESNTQGKSIIHAQKFNLKDNWFSELTFYDFNEQGLFIGRYDAKEAKLEGQEWELQQVHHWTPKGEQSKFYPYLTRSANFSIGKIEENYASPETLSFWKIPDFIYSLRKTGLSVHRYKMYWHKQIAKGGLMLAMTFLAVLFCLQPQRYRHTSSLLGIGVIAGFIIYFLSDIVYALGTAEKIPLFLAVWLVPSVTLMLSVAFLLHIEHSK